MFNNSHHPDRCQSPFVKGDTLGTSLGQQRDVASFYKSIGGVKSIEVDKSITFDQEKGVKDFLVDLVTSKNTEAARVITEMNERKALIGIISNLPAREKQMMFESGFMLKTFVQQNILKMRENPELMRKAGKSAFALDNDEIEQVEAILKECKTDSTVTGNNSQPICGETKVSPPK